MRYIIDIDGTICESDGDYPTAKPHFDRIKKINELYDEGHVIIYWTARGMKTKTDWTHLTEQQLKEWGCKYHALRMRKPQYDVWIDDKAQWPF